MEEVCQLFQEIAAEMWDLIARNNDRGNPIDERGLSGEHIISAIQDFVLDTKSTKIFAQRAIKEPRRGGDLEIFIEYSERQYLRYFLQAKALKDDGHYHDVNHRVNGIGPYQWALLLNYSRRAKALPRYLFYNGIADFHHSDIDCLGRHNERQYGCTIAEVPLIRDYCLRHNTGLYPFLINNTPPPVGLPWRFIPCCDNSSEIKEQLSDGTLRLYDREEINMDKAFEKVFRFPRISGPPPEIEEEAEIEQINNELSETGWNPSGRVIVSKFGIKHGGSLHMLY